MVMDTNCVQNVSTMPLLNMEEQTRQESSVVLIVHIPHVPLPLVQEEVMLKSFLVHFVLQKMTLLVKSPCVRIVAVIYYRVQTTHQLIKQVVNI